MFQLGEIEYAGLRSQFATLKAGRGVRDYRQGGGAMLIPVERIEKSILFLRGQKVMLDSVLADLYGVTTKRLNEQVRRNAERFPQDFLFRLNAEEKEEVVANCDHLAKLKFSPVLPYAFTEHGAIMAASVLNSPRAVEVSIYVVRAFVKLREMVASNAELDRRLDELEQKYDAQFRVVFNAIRQLMVEPATGDKQIGFKVKEPTESYSWSEQVNKS
jgi:ORF6N domain